MCNAWIELMSVALRTRDRYRAVGRLALVVLSAAIAGTPLCRMTAAEATSTNGVSPQAVSNAVGRATAEIPAGDAVYDDIAVFTEALLLVKRQYAEEKEFRSLIYGAIDGMLVSLDPHSGFLPPEAFQELQEDTS